MLSARVLDAAGRWVRQHWLVVFAGGVGVAVLFGLSFFLFFKQATTRHYLQYPSDLQIHLALVRLMLEGSYRLPLAGFHLVVGIPVKLLGMSLEWSASLVLASAVTVLAVVIYGALRRALGDDYPAIPLMIMTGILMTVTAVYVPFFNQYVYLGQGSPNTWHSPTIIAAKPLALLAFLLLTGTRARDTATGSRHGHYIVGSLALLASTAIKPSFAIVFVPALLVALPWLKNRSDAWKTALAFLPTILLLGYQYGATYIAHAGAGFDVVTPSGNVPVVVVDRVSLSLLSVWRLYSPCVPVSILLALAFPLAVTLSRFRTAVRDPRLVTSWLMVLIGMTMFACLTEVARAQHGNFGWSYYMAMQVLFVFAAVQYLRWLRSWRTMRLRQKAGAVAVSLVLLLHAVSGLYYFTRILLGGAYS